MVPVSSKVVLGLDEYSPASKEDANRRLKGSIGDGGMKAVCRGVEFKYSSNTKSLLKDSIPKPVSFEDPCLFNLENNSITKKELTLVVAEQG